jgi:hypothetical protein
MRTRILAAVLGLPLVAGFALVAVPAAVAASDTSALVNVGSPATPFSQNKQNEPAVAIDPMHPNVVVAGANDNIDEEACNAGDDTTCPFTPGVSGSGVYFSFDSGHTWTQPTYTGFSARGCLGVVGNADPNCVPNPSGPIGTVPKYFENGLVADGDPAVAFGPKPASNGTFSWSNGSRLYYANLTSAHPTQPTQLKGFEGIAVSRTDHIATAAGGGAAGKAAWMDPVIVSKQASATFSDKEQIWIDNASSSPFFGTAYVCFARFQGGGAAPMVVATSRDGGDTWASKQVSPGHNVSPKHFGQSGCSIRTDSEGNVYVFYEEFQTVAGPAGLPVGTHFMVTSTNGGTSWSRPTAIGRVTDPCISRQFDGTSLRCVHDGLAGARNDLSAAPSVSIANGAPTGAGATDEIVLTWVDGRDGVNHEHVLVRFSTDKGATWSAPAAVETTGDRGYYSAPALSPDGKDLYLVYNAFTTPFRNDTSSSRGLVGVVLHADVAASGTVGTLTEVNRGAVGDPRASSQNNMFLEFLGDYVYAAATNDYAVAVWNDTRAGADCPAIDTWRAQAQTTRSIAGRPAPQQQCPANFGNSDIFGWSGLDPSTP